MNIYWLCWSSSIAFMILSKILAKSACLLISQIALKEALSPWSPRCRDKLFDRDSHPPIYQVLLPLLSVARLLCTVPAALRHCSCEPQCKDLWEWRLILEVGSPPSTALCAGRRRRAAQTSSTSALQSRGAPPRRPPAASGVQRH